MRKITTAQLQDFKTYLLQEEKADATLEKYLRDMRYFKLWLEDRAVDKETVLQYKEKLCGDYAPASVNAALSSLNSFFSFVGWNDCKVKTLRIQRQLFAEGNRELTKAEYQRLLCVAKKKGDKRLYYLMQTICSTGIRVSELQHITVQAAEVGQATIRCKGKMRVVLLSKELCRMLLMYAKERKIKNGPIFVTKTRNPLDRSTIWKMMKGLCEAAGVLWKKVFPHNLRHLFARTFYAVQKDIVRLADILGHSNVNTTRIYTMETGAVHRRQLQKLGLLRL